ncbi:hypothetical protein [Streptomyces atroolivaceus]|uniref:hypothetical protein n=1 Tax=Streptomyces atroolivaceus TaxID=66869 RepID=UPI003674460B
MRSNPWMRALLEETDVEGLTPRDIPPPFREVAERGWTFTAAGGRVLAGLSPETPARHSDRLVEETTVNGRGMTDHDLPVAPAERTPLLVRRCLAYVCACLSSAREQFGDTQVRACVSLSYADTDDCLLTAYVTFCTPLPDVPPYVRELEEVENTAVGEFSSEDCPIRR